MKPWDLPLSTEEVCPLLLYATDSIGANYEVGNYGMHLGKSIKLVATAFSFLLIPALLLPTSVASADEPVEGLDLVILVDESGSLKQSGIRSEIEALSALLGSRELISKDDVEVRVSVIGFGSGVKAADVKCPLSKVTDSNSEALLSCAAKIKLRTTKESRNTDFAAAFNAASKQFGTGEKSDSRRAVILMTDGTYDPSGKASSAGLTDLERGNLNTSLTLMSKSDVQVWPLGFGKAEEDDLDYLAVQGGATSCPTGTPKPSARIVPASEISSYLFVILSSMRCKQIIEPTTIPDEFSVHPLISRVTLTVRGALREPLTTDGTGSNVDVCESLWVRSSDGSMSCEINITGGQSGKWKVTTTEKTPTRPTVEKSFTGEIELSLSNCSVGAPTVGISRADKTAIAWSSAQGTTWAWPAVDVKVDGKSEQLRLEKASVPSTFEKVSAGEQASVALAPDQPEFIWLRAEPAKCNGAQPATTDGPTTTSGDDGDGGGGTPIWLYLLGALALAAVAFLLIRRSKGGKFPFGTEISQFKQQGASASWSSRADISGMKEIGLSIDANGWVHVEDASASTIVLRVSRKKDLGDYVVITKAVGDDGMASQENYYTYGTDAAFSNVRIKIDPPVDAVEDEY
jgi:hypothetical protein